MKTRSRTSSASVGTSKLSAQPPKSASPMAEIIEVLPSVKRVKRCKFDAKQEPKKSIVKPPTPQSMDELRDQKTDEIWSTIMRVGTDLKREKEQIKSIDISDLKSSLSKTFKKHKESEQQLRIHEANSRKAGTTRSGKKRGVVDEKSCHFEGKYVNKGIDDSQERFQLDEQEYLENQMKKMRQVKELKFDHIRYLVTQVYLNDLKDIKAGKLDSKIHNDYIKLQGKSRQNILSEIRMNLFTDEQNAYIYGLLQGAFGATEIDANGDIKHSEIQYNNVVMLTEVSIRIVKHVLKFSTNEEALKHIVKSWNEDYGFENDD